MIEMLNAASAEDSRHAIELGRLIAETATLRQMSLGVAGMLSREEDPNVSAAIVKDLGATLEQKIPEVAHDLFYLEPQAADSPLAQVMDPTLRATPSTSIRGGAREILRGIIARGLEQ